MFIVRNGFYPIIVLKIWIIDYGLYVDTRLDIQKLNRNIKAENCSVRYIILYDKISLH